MNSGYKQQINGLKNLLGDELLAFILGIESAALGEMTPNSNQLQALEKIIPALNVFGGQNDIERSLSISQALCSYIDSLETSWATYLHYFCLNIPLPDLSYVKDSAEKSIMTVARDTYPALLVRRDRLSFSIMMPSSFMHPLGKQFNTDILRTSNPIRKLFPNAKPYRYYKSHPNEVFSLNRNIIFSNGHGGTISAGIILESVLSTAIFIQKADMDPIVSYAQAAQASYKRLRHNIAKGVLKISTIIGLLNVDMNETNNSFKVSEGVIIRKPTLIDKVAFWGDTAEPTMIVEITDNVHILDSYLMSEEDPSKPFARYDKYKNIINQFYREQQKKINNVRLAMLLASKDDTFIAPGYVFTTSLNPISMNRNSAISPYKWSSVRYEKQTIDESRAIEIHKWLLKLNRLPDSFDVSVKRLISASTERLDDADAFIDAVMVWENLFGAKQETTFRISSALSMALEPHDKIKRKELLGEIKQLYEKRSRLVHGAPSIDISNINNEKTRSIAIAIKALQVVASSKKLSSSKSSENRDEIILLGVSQAV